MNFIRKLQIFRCVKESERERKADFYKKYISIRFISHILKSKICIFLDDQFLITFLRGCKFSIQKAKEKIDLFFTVREEIPELIRNRDPLDKRIAAMLKLG